MLGKAPNPHPCTTARCSIEHQYRGDKSMRAFSDRISLHKYPNPNKKCKNMKSRSRRGQKHDCSGPPLCARYPSRFVGLALLLTVVVGLTCFRSKLDTFREQVAFASQTFAQSHPKSEVGAMSRPPHPIGKSDPCRS
jgi:hypothetical protein